MTEASASVGLLLATALTLFRYGENISFKIDIKTANLHVCRVGVWGGQLSIYLITKVSERSNGSIPQMCPTVAKTTFQTVGTGLRQSQFVFNISFVFNIFKSIVLKGLNWSFRYFRDWSFKVLTEWSRRWGTFPPLHIYNILLLLLLFTFTTLLDWNKKPLCFLCRLHRPPSITHGCF